MKRKQGKPMAMKEKRIVKKTVDLTKPPRVSAAQKARLKAIAEQNDESIDYSDTPSLQDAVWVKAASNLPQTKQQITLRIDAEILDYFKNMGTRYQTRINAVLRAYVMAHKGLAK
jgi:uncharacterized protein (DUF4415 family)